MAFAFEPARRVAPRAPARLSRTGPAYEPSRAISCSEVPLSAEAAILAVTFRPFGVTVTDEPRVGSTRTRSPAMEPALPVSVAVIVTFLPFCAAAPLGSATAARLTRTTAMTRVRMFMAANLRRPGGRV